MKVNVKCTIDEYTFDTLLDLLKAEARGQFILEVDKMEDGEATVDTLPDASSIRPDAPGVKTVSMDGGYPTIEKWFKAVEQGDTTMLNSFGRDDSLAMAGDERVRFVAEAYGDNELIVTRGANLSTFKNLLLSFKQYLEADQPAVLESMRLLVKEMRVG